MRSLPLVALSIFAATLLLPRQGGAQRVEQSYFSRPAGSAGLRTFDRVARTPQAAVAPDSVVQRSVTPPVAAPHRSRKVVALRGLALGAVVGGVIGYFAHRDEEYGGAVLGPIMGAVIGAPIGMIVLLFATPL